jgi:hypothetical protein
MFDWGFTPKTADAATTWAPNATPKNSDSVKEVQIAIVDGEAFMITDEERDTAGDVDNGAPTDEEEAAPSDDDDAREGAEAETEVETEVIEQVLVEQDAKCKDIEMVLEEPVRQEVVEKDEHTLSIVKLPNELDFDDGPTELFLSLQRQDWEASLARARQGPEEACIWISRKEEDGESIRWRLLPIHAAVIFGAPAPVVTAVLDAFPLGARARDDQGMLPLHLVFRTGGQQELVNMLLACFPEGVTIENSKGRTPLDIAKASTSPHRDAYVETLSGPPPATSQVASALAQQRIAFEIDLVEALAKHENDAGNQGENFDSQLLEMHSKFNDEKLILEAEAKEERTKLEELISSMENDMVKTQEDSQVLVDHVASLESQLESRSETERFLATRISNLHAFLKDTSKSKEDVEVRLKSEIAQLLEEKLELQKTVSSFHDEKAARAKTQEEAQAVAASEEMLALEKSLREAKTTIAILEETNEEKAVESAKLTALKQDLKGARAESSKLKADIMEHMEKEAALSSRVSTLALQLADSLQNSSTEKHLIDSKIRSLETEREGLRSTVQKLSSKLYHVAGFIKEMTQGQQAIIDQIAEQEREIAAAAGDKTDILHLVELQRDLFSKIEKEREDLVVASKKHEATIKHRDLTMNRGQLVREATYLKHQLMGAMGSALAGIPKEVDESDDDMVDEVLRTVLSAPQSAWKSSFHLDDALVIAEVKSSLEKDDETLEEVQTEEVPEDEKKTDGVKLATPEVQLKTREIGMMEEENMKDDSEIDPANLPLRAKIAMLEKSSSP